jgi:hypothetical protein
MLINITNMYRLGERKHSHRRFYIWFIGFAIFLAALFGFGHHYLKSNTHIGSPPPVVTKKISYDPPAQTIFNENLFSIGVPSGWKLVTRNDIPAPTYTWQGTTGDDQSRWLSVYVDMSLPAFAVNRELHIMGSGSAINVVSDTSDNCTSFTGASTAQNHGSAPAKWEGIDFLCDVGNYERDVVGIVSSDGFNTVSVTGASSMHHFFFTYTDNSVRPDYSIFTNSLKSFRLK